MNSKKVAISHIPNFPFLVNTSNQIHQSTEQKLKIDKELQRKRKVSIELC